MHGHAGALGTGGGQRGSHSHVHPAGEGGNGLLCIAGEHGGLFGVGQQMLCPHRRIAEAFCTGMGLDAGSLRQALRLRHQGDGLQHIKAADGTAGQMHLGAALHGGCLDLCVEIQIRKGTDGQNDQIDAPLQHRDGHGAHRLHRGSLHDVLRLKRQQRVHVLADGAADIGGGLFSRGAGAAGHAHQLVVRQQTLLPRVSHDVAQKSAANNTQFCFHTVS